MGIHFTSVDGVVSFVAKACSLPLEPTTPEDIAEAARGLHAPLLSLVGGLVRNLAAVQETTPTHKCAMRLMTGLASLISMGRWLSEEAEPVEQASEI